MTQHVIERALIYISDESETEDSQTPMANLPGYPIPDGVLFRWLDRAMEASEDEEEEDEKENEDEEGEEGEEEEEEEEEDTEEFKR